MFKLSYLLHRMPWTCQCCGSWGICIFYLRPVNRLVFLFYPFFSFFFPDSNVIFLIKYSHNGLEFWCLSGICCLSFEISATEKKRKKVKPYSCFIWKLLFLSVLVWSYYVTFLSYGAGMFDFWQDELKFWFRWWLPGTKALFKCKKISKNREGSSAFTNKL